MAKKKVNMTGKIHEHPNAGKGDFSANPQNINLKGRPRRLVSNVISELKEKGVKSVSQTDIKDTFLMLINLEISEVEELIKDDKCPAIVRIVGKEMLGGKGFEVIEKMIDRAIGKSEETVNHKGVDVAINVQRRKK